MSISSLKLRRSPHSDIPTPEIQRSSVVNLIFGTAVMGVFPLPSRYTYTFEPREQSGLHPPKSVRVFAAQQLPIDTFSTYKLHNYMTKVNCGGTGDTPETQSTTGMAKFYTPQTSALFSIGVGPFHYLSDTHT